MSTAGPYSDKSINRIYQSLFCDNLALFENNTNDYPWDALFGESSAALGELLINPLCDPRIQLLAANQLRKLDLLPPTNRLLGVVLEVNLPEGLDTLAAYKNGVATYISYSEKSIFWDSTTAESDLLTNQLFEEGIKVHERLSPWPQERLDAPHTNHLRINFLAEHGLYFGQGPISMLFNDTLTRPTLLAATNLMRYLVDTPLTPLT
ncbi:MAG: hypothetical protein K9H63_03560 [Sphingobacteriaceae bacterium]|nr:hypothetical protein [Sphingobacteriaceae bacterium]